MNLCGCRGKEGGWLSPTLRNSFSFKSFCLEIYPVAEVKIFNFFQKKMGDEESGSDWDSISENQPTNNSRNITMDEANFITQQSVNNKKGFFINWKCKDYQISI